MEGRDSGLRTCEVCQSHDHGSRIVSQKPHTSSNLCQGNIARHLIADRATRYPTGGDTMGEAEAGTGADAGGASAGGGGASCTPPRQPERYRCPPRCHRQVAHPPCCSTACAVPRASLNPIP
eukprot:364294-Chlamydomonas_euryale.AAC.4